MSDITVNSPIVTPNGPGVVQGRMYDNGAEYILVRHTLAQMTGETAGRCCQERARLRISGIWAYTREELGA